MEVAEDLVNVYEKLNENDKALDLAVKIIKLSPKNTLPTVSLNAWGYNILNYSDVLSSYLKINGDNLDDNVRLGDFCQYFAFTFESVQVLGLRAADRTDDLKRYFPIK